MVRVNIVVVRHGLSCHNVVYSYYLRGKVPAPVRWMTDRIWDPPLVPEGIEVSEALGPFLAEALAREGIGKVHVLGASVLTRAVQTAHYMAKAGWPGQELKVHVLPFIAECGADPWGGYVMQGAPESMPLDRGAQQRFLDRHGIVPDTTYVPGSLRYGGSDFERCLDTVLPKVIQDACSGGDPGPEGVNVVLFSHGNAIRGILESRGRGSQDVEVNHHEAFLGSGTLDLTVGEWTESPGQFKHLVFRVPESLGPDLRSIRYRTSWADVADFVLTRKRLYGGYCYYER